MASVRIHEQLLQDALRQASLSTETVCRPMLGGQGVSVKGNLFALLLPSGIGLRLPPEEQGHFLTIPGTSRLDVPGDTARSRLWVVAPESLAGSVAHFSGWVRKAYGFVERTVPAARRGAPKPGRRAPGRR